MARVVLTADPTLMSRYRNIPLGDFLGCVPAHFVPRKIFNFIAPLEPPLTSDGIARIAPYGLRKIEAALLMNGYSRKDVVVVHPNYVHNFIGDDTEIVGHYTMDPYGLGPVSMMFTVGRKYKSYDEIEFRKFMTRLNIIRRRRGLKFKIVVGGPGTWQLEYMIDESKRSGINHIVIGEAEHIIHEIFDNIRHNDAPEVIRITTWPSIEQIPTIVGASVKGLVEVMRGCGRGCAFCLPNLRIARYMPLEKIVKEVKVNIAYGERTAWLHSEDIFLYKVEDKRNFIPNKEAVLELFRTITNIRGLKECHPTHSSIAPVVADPEMIKELSHILKAGPRHWIGIQPGLETGSGKLIKKHMPNKVKPFSPDEWQDVAVQATIIFNKYYWFPAYTLIIGLPGETEDDCWDTVRLLDRLEKEVPRIVGKSKTHFITAPLSFVPLAALKKEKILAIDEEMNEARFCVIYRAWRIIVREIYRSLHWLVDQPPHIKLMIDAIAMIGGKLILSRLEKYGKERGYRIEKCLYCK